jgi:predicted nucleic-acid-binding Zn-ribbon protein
MICPKCGSEDVKSEQKQAVNVSVKMKRGNGCLWWLLLGWIYLIYVMFVWLIKAMYFIFIGWWTTMIKKHKQAVESRTVVHVCQNCGYRWETK